MFPGDTKLKQRSGQGIGSAWQTTNRAAGAQQHTTAEAIAAQDAAQSRRQRPLRTPIGGGGLSVGIYNNANAYAIGSIVFVQTTTTISGITILPGCYICAVAVAASGTANQIPQYPLPTSGLVYWYCIAMGINLVNTCSGGSSGTIYLNSSGSF